LVVVPASYGGAVFVVLCRPGVFVFSPDKAAVEKVERERKKNKEKVAETGKKLIFWLILDPIFSSFKLSNPPQFIGGGTGKSWLKVGMVHCQTVKSAAAGCLSWPL